MTTTRVALAVDRVRAQKDSLRLLEQQKRQLEDARSQAQSAFEVAKRELDDVTAAHDRVDSQFKQLSALIESDIRTIHAHALSRLPQEVLRAVFIEHAHDEEPDYEFDDGVWDMSRAAAPFVLTSVCKAWRQLGLQCQAMWTYAAIPPLDEYDENRKRLLTGRLSYVLTRSGRAPLDILVPWEDEELGWHHQEALQSLAREHVRWRRLYFELPAADAINATLFDVFRLPMPLLEDVYISNCDNILPWRADFPQYFPARSRLQSFQSFATNLTYTGTYAGGSTNLAILNIGVDGVPASVLWGILAESAATLSDLHLRCVSHSPPLDRKPQAAVTLPKLLRLVMDGLVAELLAYWAGFFVAPHLDNCTLSGCDILAVDEFVQTACRSITALTLRDQRVVAAAAQALGALKKLNHLSLENVNVEDDFLDAFGHAHGAIAGEWLLPALWTLFFTNVSFLSAESDVLLRVLRARRAAAADSKAVVRIGAVILDDCALAPWMLLMVQGEMRIKG